MLSPISVHVRMCVRFWSIYSVILLSCLNDANVIVTSPRNITVCAGTNAEFNCATTGAASIAWSVDGLDPSLNAVRARNISYITSDYYHNSSSNGYTSTLTVYGSIANSNSSIKCIVWYNSVRYETDVAILLVQGSTEGSLKAKAMALNSTHVVLTWSPPGDALDPALLYYIVVVRNGVATQAQLAASVNGLRAIVLSSLLSTCDAFFSIQPMCSITSGRESTVRRYTIDVVTEHIDDTTKISILGSAVPSIKYYSVVFINWKKNCNFTVESFSDSDSFISLLSVDQNEKFFANITIYDDKHCKNERLIVITTFDVIMVRLLEPPLRIQCSFNMGSTAKGCLALFDDGNRSYYFFIRRNSTSNEATSDTLQGVPSGNYTLLTYDVETTGRPHGSPALSENVSIVGQEFIAPNEVNITGVVLISTNNSSICVNCKSTGCLALIRSSNGSTELHVHSVEAGFECFQSAGNRNYSVAVFTIGYDGVIMNRPVVNQQISLYSNAEKSPTCTSNFSFAAAGVSSQCIYIGSTLSVLCTLLLALLVASLVALVNKSRMLKMKAKAESKSGPTITMNENEAYISVRAASTMSSVSKQ